SILTAVGGGLVNDLADSLPASNRDGDVGAVGDDGLDLAVNVNVLVGLDGDDQRIAGAFVVAMLHWPGPPPAGDRVYGDDLGRGQLGGRTFPNVGMDRALLAKVVPERPVPGVLDGVGSRIVFPCVAGQALEESAHPFLGSFDVESQAMRLVAVMAVPSAAA